MLFFMNILMISQDANILVSESPVRTRMRSYAQSFGKLSIIVPAQGKKETEGETLVLYPLGTRHVLLALLRLFLMGPRIASAERFDIVTAQGADEFGLGAYWIARRLGIPFQLQIHTDIMSPWYRNASWKEGIRYRIARFLVPRANCIRTVSERVRRSLETAFPAQKGCITAVPIMADVSRFLSEKPLDAPDPRLRRYDFKMIAVGRFVDKEKNFSLLISMMRDFVSLYPRALLILAGDGPDRAHYEEMVARLGLGENIMIEKWRDDLPALYKSCDLFLLSSNYEGWGRAVLEAMAAGLPVVMTDVGLAGEVVRDRESGSIVPVGDKKAFFAACRALLTMAETRREMGIKARETAAKFNVSSEEYLSQLRNSFSFCTPGKK